MLAAGHRSMAGTDFGENRRQLLFVDAREVGAPFCACWFNRGRVHVTELADVLRIRMPPNWHMELVGVVRATDMDSVYCFRTGQIATIIAARLETTGQSALDVAAVGDAGRDKPSDEHGQDDGSASDHMGSSLSSCPTNLQATALH